MRKIFILFFIISISYLFAENIQKKELEFHTLIDQTYNFMPCKATDAMRSEKAKVMDKIWDMVDKDPKLYLPLLRKEIKNYNRDDLFLYDGSVLLMKHSKTKEDLDLVVEAISKVSFCAVDQTNYFRTVHSLGHAGINTWSAVKHILKDPKFSVSVPDHAMRLGQNYSVLYCLLTLDDSLYIDELINQLKAEKNEITIKTIILCLAFTISKKGQDAIQSFIKDTKNVSLKNYALVFMKLEKKSDLPKREIKTSRKLVDEFFSLDIKEQLSDKRFQTEDFSKDLPYLIKSSDYKTLKEIRKRLSVWVSDEAISIIDQYTQLMQFAFTSED